MRRIFINYRRQDSEGYVGRLYDHLARHFPTESIFMDVDSIPPGADFRKTLEDAVAACDVFIAVIGPQWVSITDEAGARRLDQWNDFVRIEIEAALKQDKLIIPALVGGAKAPAPSDVPEDIAGLSYRNAVELSHAHFTDDVERLVTAIKDIIPPDPTCKPPGDEAALSRKQAAVKSLRDELLRATDSPLFEFRSSHGYFPVIGEGNPDTNILFIGESPGKNEAAQGRPFIGPSGEVLDEMLRQIGLARDDVFITNLLLDHPGDHEPTKDELAFYTPYLDQLIDIIQPAVIATLGRFAGEYMLGKLGLRDKGSKLSRIHGMLIKAQMPYGDIHIVPLYHPAVVLYSASQKDTLRKDFEKLRVFV
jgi:uracil-DNA glycosylase